MPLKFDGNINLSSVATSLGTNTHNLSLVGLSGASLIWITATGNFDLTGLTGGEEGRVIFIGLRGTFTITIPAESGSSLAENRFAQSATISGVTAGSIVTAWVYFGSRWRRWK
jgi:hypothetical protein